MDVTVSTRGDVADGEKDHARKRVGALEQHVSDPVPRAISEPFRSCQTRARSLASGVILMVVGAGRAVWLERPQRSVRWTWAC